MIKQIIFSFCPFLRILLTDFSAHCCDLLFQIMCRHSPAALPEDNDLLQRIGRRHRDIILSSDCMDRFFNVLVRCLRFLRVDYINIVILLYTSLSAFHAICVKDENQIHFFVSLIITQNIHQLRPRRLHIDLCKLV